MRIIVIATCILLVSPVFTRAEEVIIHSITVRELSDEEKLSLESLKLNEEKAEQQKKGVEGLASWYGGKFQGRKTASGEVFDTRKFTAAHRTLPFGTMVKVENLDNGKFTKVRINDRGPFVDDRIIDLSQAAAVQIDMMKTGIARVRIEVIESPVKGKTHFYRIQVASFKKRGNAQKIRNILIEKGYAVYFESTSEGHTRVHVDNVPRSELKNVQSALRRIGFEKQLVRKID